MDDKKMSRVFLKRIEAPNVKLADFYIGANVTIHSRIIRIVEYGDIATQRKQCSERECTFGMIKPCSYQNIGKIIDAVH